MSDTNPSSASNSTSSDQTPKVTGIGGVFFYSDDPKASQAWYAKNLGIDAGEWGASFESRNLQNPEVVETLQWCLFKKSGNYFAPSQKEFMINYRVQHLEALVAQLKENGVTILDDLASYDYGKFVHILDGEGNKIELWEPLG